MREEDRKRKISEVGGVKVSLRLESLYPEMKNLHQREREREREGREREVQYWSKGAEIKEKRNSP